MFPYYEGKGENEKEKLKSKARTLVWFSFLKRMLGVWGAVASGMERSLEEFLGSIRQRRSFKWEKLSEVHLCVMPEKFCLIFSCERKKFAVSSNNINYPTTAET